MRNEMFIESPTVADLLQHKPDLPVTIGPDERLEVAARKLNERRFGILVVVDPNGAVVGVMSERDIVRAVARTQPCDVQNERVRTIMTSRIIACGVDDRLTDILDEMKRRHIRHMPVLTDERTLVGLVSLADVLTFLKDNAATLTEEVMWSHALTHL